MAKARAKEEAVVAQEIEATKEFTLPNEVVYVKPNVRNTGWIKNPKHRAFFMMEGTAKILMAPLQKNGQIKNVLNKEEKAFLEKEMQMDENGLSVYKKPEENFWASFQVRLTKDVSILNLSDPHDYIKYKILLSHVDLVAPSPRDVKNKATYKFFLEKPAEAAKMKSEELDSEARAWELYGEMASNKQKMLDFLRVYGEINKEIRSAAHGLDKSSSMELVKSTIRPILASKNRDIFYNILTDKNYESRLLLSKAVRDNLVERKGTSYYDKGSGKAFATSFKQAVDFITNPENGDFRQLLESQVD